MITLGLGLIGLLNLHGLEPGALKQHADLVSGIQTFGIELVGDDTLIGVGHNLARHQATAVLGQGPFAADELVLVDPLPRAALVMLFQPCPVGNVEVQHAAGFEHPNHRFQDFQVITVALEKAK